MILILKFFMELKIILFNISDEFFNNVCISYSKDGNDMIL